MFDQDAIGQTRIARAITIAVDAETRVCDVRLLDSNSPILRNVPWSSAALSPGGDGIDFCPDVGYFCWVIVSDSNFRSASDSSATILAFTPPLVGSSYGVDREPLLPGDVKIGTAAGARIFMDAGLGDLQIEGGAGASTTFFNTARLIETIAGDIRCITDGGEFLWRASSGQTELRMDVKKSSADEAGFAIVSAGSEGGVGQLSLAVMRDGALGAGDFVEGSADLVGTPGVGALFEGTQEGEVRLHAGATLTVTGNQRIDVRAGYVINIEADAVEVVSKSGDARVRIAGGDIEVTGTRVSVVTGDLSVVDMNRGGMLLHTGSEEIDEQNKQLVTEEILPWLFNHTHPTPGGVSGAPLGSPADVESVTPPALNLVALKGILTEMTTTLSAAGIPVPPTVTDAIEGLTNEPPASIISVTTREDVLTQDTKVR